MKTLIIKELREHVWLFAAGLAIVTLGYLRSMYALLPAQVWLHVSRRSFFMVTSIGGAGFMVVLGFRQMFEELRRGSWLFLIHRPLAPQRIFLAKVLAALIMFFAAVCAPTIAIAGWCSWPGHVAGPIEWSMFAPAAIDLLCALPYYFAGCVIGLWQARWTLSRGLILVMPLANSLLAHAILPYAWMAAVSATMVTLWLLWLARAAFLGLERQSRTNWGVLAVTLWFGLCGAHLGALAFMPRPIDDEPRVSRPAEDVWFVSTDGDIRRARVQGHNVTAVFSEAGERIPGDYEGAEMWLSDLGAPEIGIAPNQLSFPSRVEYRSPRRFVRVAQLAEDYSREWYFDYEQRRFIAYDRANKRRAGSMGPDGFSSAGDAAPFDGDPLMRLEVAKSTIVFGGGVYRVDWARPAIVPIPLSSPGPLLRCVDFRGDGSTSRMVLRSSTHIEVIAAGKPVLAIALDQSSVSNELSLGYIQAKQEYFVRYPRLSGDPAIWGMRRYHGETILFYDSAGREIRRWTTPEAPTRPPVTFQIVTRPLQPAVVAPPALIWTMMIWERGGGWERDAWSATHALIALLVGVLSALASLWFSRGQQRGIVVLIASLCVLGGPFGILLPWLLPRRRGVVCPSCGEVRELTQAPCGACNQPLDGHLDADESIIDDAFLPASEST